MAQPNGNSPLYPGPVAAQSFQSTVVPNISGTSTQQPRRYIPQTIRVMTNGTTEVDVFATANPVAGTFLGTARIIAIDDIAGNITLQHTSAGTVLFTIAKGSQGAMKGSSFAAAAFAIDGTATVKSSVATANAIVEIDFIASNPALQGAQ